MKVAGEAGEAECSSEAVVLAQPGMVSAAVAAGEEATVNPSFTSLDCCDDRDRGVRTDGRHQERKPENQDQ